MLNVVAKCVCLLLCSFSVVCCCIWVLREVVFGKRQTHLSGLAIAILTTISKAKMAFTNEPHEIRSNKAPALFEIGGREWGGGHNILCIFLDRELDGE